MQYQQKNKTKQKIQIMQLIRFCQYIYSELYNIKNEIKLKRFLPYPIIK